jgi:hypothetical protein
MRVQTALTEEVRAVYEEEMNRMLTSDKTAARSSRVWWTPAGDVCVCA